MDDNDPHCQHWRVCSDCYGRTYGERMESEIAQLRAYLARAEATIAKLRESLPSDAERQMAEAVMDELRHTAGGYRASDIIAPWLARLDAARKVVL